MTSPVFDAVLETSVLCPYVRRKPWLRRGRPGVAGVAGV